MGKPPMSILALMLITGCATVDLSRRAQADLFRYISAEDYPHAALRAGEQGIVGFALDVSAEGRITECTILQSSGSASLDRSTCAILQRRARFTPALDRKGQPVPDRVTNRMRWILPEGPSAPAEGRSTT